MVEHKKLAAILTFVAVLVIVGGVSWALISFNAPPELSIREQVRDDAVTYIKSSYPGTA